MRRYNDGFTLIELILVMALVAILSVIGIGSYTQATLKSRDTERKSDLNQIAKALESFNNDVGRYPNVENGEMVCPGSDGDDVSCGDAIYAYIGSAKATYMNELPTDPLANRAYVYVPVAGSGEYAYYAALENTQDKDVVTVDGVPDDWDIQCGDVTCNYKITETGLVRTKE